MKLRHILVLSILFLAQNGLAQTSWASGLAVEADPSYAFPVVTAEAGGLIDGAATCTLNTVGSFAETFVAKAPSGGSCYGFCDTLRDLCLHEGIFTPRQCVQQYRACVESFCS